MSAKILVTGATGKIGGEVVTQLEEASAPFRAMVRDPDAAGLGDGVELAQADFGDVDSVAAALEGIESVFLLWPSGSDETAAQVVDAISNEASRIVYISASGLPERVDEQTDPITRSHRHLEDLIVASGLEWTFVRPGGLAGNTLGWASEIRSEGVVREPFGGMPRALIHEADVAEVAVRALTEDGHAGQRYDVSGPAVVTGAEQVRAISEAIGRPLELVALSREEALERMTEAMGDEATARGMVDGWERMAQGEPEQPTDTVLRVLGHPATPFAQWARDHAADFT